jgi:hypothetical protein
MHQVVVQQGVTQAAQPLVNFGGKKVLDASMQAVSQVTQGAVALGVPLVVAKVGAIVAAGTAVVVAHPVAAAGVATVGVVSLVKKITE